MKLDGNAINNVLTEKTENGATAYASTNYAIVDFNFKVPFYRTQSVKDIQLDFAKVYYENPLLALKDLFYLGDIREGLGERKIFKAGLAWLCEHEPEVANKIIPLIPEYSRWDIVVGLGPDNLIAVKTVLEQLQSDLENMGQGKAISLLGKWMPSINTSSKETRAEARKWVKLLKVSEKEYRKVLSALRAYLDVVEVKTSTRQWDKINYSAVPSVANLKYNYAFMRHDRERREEYLASLKNGETKVNASVLYPHQIVAKYEYLDTEDTLLEEAWKRLPTYSAGDTLVVRDGSGSMTGLPLQVATALAIYTAQKNTGVWHNKFLTFSAFPELVDITGANSLLDALHICERYDDWSNTNIEATMKLILDAAVAAKAELPDSILIISDMQFDATQYGNNKTNFEQIAKMYVEAGYVLPRMVFWNVSTYNHALVQLKSNADGLVEMSGFSVALLKQVLSNKTDPYEVLCDTLDVPRYNKILEVLD